MIFKKNQICLLAFVLVMFSIPFCYSQTKVLLEHNELGKIYYKSGQVEEGKLSFDLSNIIIKYPDKTKKKVISKNVKKIAIYRKNTDSIYYTFVLSKLNSKSKRKFLCELVYDGDNIKIYTERIISNGIVGGGSYFIQKKGDPYAVRWIKPFKKASTLMNSHFKDCPSLLEKIETKEFRIKNIIAIAEYYETNCERQERKRSTGEGSQEDRRAAQIEAREAKRKALKEKREKALNERAEARQKRLDSIKKAREK